MSDEIEGFTSEEPMVPAFIPPPPEPEPVVPGSIQFDERVKNDFEGLLYLGKLQKGFRWGGHSFRIKTLTSEERLRAAVLCKPWTASLEEARAWLIATVALSVVSVDGKSIVPLGMVDEDAVAEAKFKWALEQFPWTIDAIMVEIDDMESRVAEAVQEMGKTSGSMATPTSGNASRLQSSEETFPRN